MRLPEGPNRQYQRLTNDTELLGFGHGCRIDPFSNEKRATQIPLCQDHLHVLSMCLRPLEHVTSMCSRGGASFPTRALREHQDFDLVREAEPEVT